jgi:FLVCR family feline leukemia virus subgroup C receptor-related protein
MDDETVRTYKRRWIMLLLFSVFSLSHAYMWIHLNIVANVVLRYYNDSLPAGSLQQETAVDWLSLVYMLCYLVGIPLGKDSLSQGCV